MTPDSTLGHPILRLIERALESNRRFDRRVTWLDPENFIPVRTAHYRGESEVFCGHTEEVRMVRRIPRSMRIVFEKVAPTETVTVVVTTIDYKTLIPEAYFSTMAPVKGRCSSSPCTALRDAVVPVAPLPSRTTSLCCSI